MPSDILLLGADHPDILAWLSEHWGTTEALHHVVLEPAFPSRHELPPGTATLQLSFWSADWTPWQGLSALAALARVALRRHADLRNPLNEGDLDPTVMTAALPPRPGSFVWEDPPRRQVAATSPVLVVEGVEAFAGAIAAAMTRGPGGPTPDFAR